MADGLSKQKSSYRAARREELKENKKVEWPRYGIQYGMTATFRAALLEDTSSLKVPA